MPSNLTSGNNLDGVIVNINGPYAARGTFNANLASASSPAAAIADVPSRIIHVDADTSLKNMVTATEENPTQTLTIAVGLGGLSTVSSLGVAGDFMLGQEVAQGDRGAAERGDLNAISSLYTTVPTGYTMLRDGRWMAGDGTIVNNQSAFGSSVNLGVDKASGNAIRMTTNFGTVSGATTSVITPNT